jgi:hypothetical protein
MGSFALSLGAMNNKDEKFQKKQNEKNTLINKYIERIIQQQEGNIVILKEIEEINKIESDSKAQDQQKQNLGQIFSDNDNIQKQEIKKYIDDAEEKFKKIKNSKELRPKIAVVKAILNSKLTWLTLGTAALFLSWPTILTYVASLNHALMTSYLETATQFLPWTLIPASAYGVNSIRKEIKKICPLAELTIADNVILSGDSKNCIDEYIKNLGKKRQDTNALILLGPPGTGKTLIAHIIASQLHKVLIKPCCPRVTARDLKSDFSLARKHEGVIFFDEVHTLSEKASDQLLLEMNEIQDNKDIIIIAATNYSKLLKEPLKRTGRFGSNVIEILRPDFLERAKLIINSLYTVFGVEMAKKMINIDFIVQTASLTDGCTASDFNVIASKANILLEQDTKIMQESITTAIKNFKKGQEALSKNYV